MNEIQKPNDIFVATLSSPNATLKDLLANNINANNTSFLTPEEYKDTPLVKKAFLNKETNTFNEDAFNKAYYNAYQKFVELTDEESYKNLEKDLEYSPNDRFRPLDAKIQNPTANIRKINNPLQQQYSVQGVNYISEPTLTPEEAAQSNNIYDPETGSFINNSPESLPFYKKVFGGTLIYAKWNEDGTHIDPISGEQVQHHKGDWKTDEEGKYYTEYLGNRELGENQVVNLQDILTDEGSMMNKVDFFDSDGYNKSAWGIAFKTMATIAPYMIPGVSGPWMVVMTGFNLLSVLPTYYKALTSMVAGDTAPNSFSTRLENWFRKFEPSKSYRGREGLFTLEGISSMLADTLGQLYQQRTAAGLASKIMKNVPQEKDFENVIEYGKALEDYSKRLNKLQTALNLGYMGLISTNDVYNDALNAGYDKHTAGITALISAGALYKIMNFNETTRGVSSWFLRDMQDANAAVSRGLVRKVAKDVMKEMQEGVSQLGKGDNTGFVKAFKTYTNKLRSYLDDVYRVNVEGVIKDAIKEGTEEVSEEVVQDTVKGLIDTLSWLGVTPQQGSFGGWENVFSAEGAKRYLETLVGGAFGGAVFNIHQNKVMPWLDGTARKKVDYDLTRVIADGRIQDVLDEMKNVKKYFNEHLSTRLGTTEDGKYIYVTKNGNEMSQADMIYNEAVKYASAKHSILTKGIDFGKYNLDFSGYIAQVNQILDNNQFTEKAFKTPFNDKINEIVKIQQDIDRLESNESLTSQDQATLKDLKEQLKVKGEELTYWTEGDGLFDYTKQGILLTTTVQDKDGNPRNLYSMIRGFSLENYALNVEGVTDINKLKNSEDPLEKKRYDKIKHDYDLFQQDLTENSDTLVEQLKIATEFLDKLNPTLAKGISDFVNNSNKEAFFRAFNDYTGSTDTELGQNYEITEMNLLDFIDNNPRFWGLSQRIKFDLANELESIKAIDLSLFTSNEEKDIIRKMINERAAYSRVNVWDKNNIKSLIKGINDDLQSNNIKDPNIKALSQVDSSEDSVVKVNKSIVSNLEDIQDQDLQNVRFAKIRSILDLIENSDSVVDKQLFDTVRNAIQIHTLNQLQKLLADNPDIVEYLVPLTTTEFYTKDKVRVNGIPNLDKFTATDFLENIELIQSLADQIGINNPLFVDENGSKVLEGWRSAETSLNKIITAINKPTKDFISEEIFNKWNEIKTKQVEQNPLLTTIADVMSKVGDTDTDKITWLYNKAMGISQGTATELTDIEENLIKDMISAVETIEYSSLCMSPRTAAAKDNYFGLDYSYSYNKAVKQHADLYGKSKEDLDALYPEFDKEELLPLNKILYTLKEQLYYMLDVKSAMDSKALAQDIKRRSTFFNTAIQTSICGKEITITDDDGNSYKFSIPKPTFDVNAPDKEKRKLLQGAIAELYNEINKNKNLKPKNIVKAILDAYGIEDPNELLTLRDIDELITETGVEDVLMATYLLANLSVSPTDIESMYIKGMEGKNLIPKFDQELAIRMAIAFNSNPSLINELLPEEYQNRMFIPGGAGTGKSTIITVVLDALGIKNPIVAAPTQAKLDDLAISVAADSDKRLVSDLFGESSKINENYVTSLQNSLFKVNEEKGEDDKTTGTAYTGLLKAAEEAEKGKEVTVQHEFTVTIASKEGTIKTNISGKKEGENLNITRIQVDPNSFEFSDDELKNFQEIYKDYKDRIVVIDEATYLSPFQLYLNGLLSRYLGTKFICLGDACQSGFDVKVGTQDSSVKFKYTAVLEPIFKTPGLVGSLRGRNTAKTDNGNYLHNPANAFKKSFTPSEESAKLLKYYTDGALVYNGLRGDQIVDNQVSFEEKLTELYQHLGSQSLIYITETEEDKNALKAILTKLGLPTSDNYFRTPESVQGGEYDYTVIYNLRGTKPLGQSYNDGDVDAAKIYTMATRSKQFSLIYEPVEDGLFKLYHITSKVAPTISDSTPTAKAKEKNDAYMTECKEVLNHLKTITPTTTTPTPSGREGTDGGGTHSGDEGPGNGNSGEGEPPSDGDDGSDDGGVSNGGSSSSSGEITVANENIESEEENKKWREDRKKFLRDWGMPEETLDKTINSEIKQRQNGLNILGDDVIQIYTYYTRLGVSKEEFDAINAAKVSSLETTMNRILANRPNDLEKSKDLLGFYQWKLKNKEIKGWSGETLLKNFIAFRNSVLYDQSPKEQYISLKKYDNNTDWAYLKPNDDINTESRNGILASYVVKLDLAETSNIPFLLTIGQIGYNRKNDHGSAYSDFLYKAKQNFRDDANRASEIFYKVHAKENIKKNDFNAAMGITNPLNIESSFIIPITRLKDVKIQSDKTTNGINALSHRNLNKISLEELLKFGYVIDGDTSVKFDKKESYLNSLDDTRTSKIIDRENVPYHENNVYVVLRPLGADRKNAPRKIYQIERILPGTIYEVLGKIPKDKGSLYFKRQALAYLRYKLQIDKFVPSTSEKYQKVNKLKDYINNDIKGNKNFNKLGFKNQEDFNSFCKDLFDWFSQTETLAMESQLLKNVFNTNDSKDFMFEYMNTFNINELGKYVVWRAIESYTGWVPLNDLTKVENPLATEIKEIKLVDNTEQVESIFQEFEKKFSNSKSESDLFDTLKWFNEQMRTLSIEDYETCIKEIASNVESFPIKVYFTMCFIKDKEHVNIFLNYFNKITHEELGDWIPKINDDLDTLEQALIDAGRKELEYLENGEVTEGGEDTGDDVEVDPSDLSIDDYINTLNELKNLSLRDYYEKWFVEENDKINAFLNNMEKITGIAPDTIGISSTMLTQNQVKTQIEKKIGNDTSSEDFFEEETAGENNQENCETLE